MYTEQVAVIGLGKLGLPLATLLAHAGHRVYGIDLDPQAVIAINRGRTSLKETDLEDLLTEVWPTAKLSASTNFATCANANLILIIVPTPSDETGRFSSEHVINAVTWAGEQIRHTKRQQVFVICSTLMPGDTDGPIRDALEKASGRRVGDTLGLIYSPEFIALGSVIDDMRYPEFMLIGASDRQSASAYETMQRSIQPAAIMPAAYHMSLVNAEIAKIALNAYVTMKISFTNQLSELCETIPGADAQTVLQAIGRDRRIGSAYLKAGTAYGGECFPRDAVAFSTLFREHKLTADLADATHAINERQVDRIVEKVRASGRKRVGILGLAYKPETPVFTEAVGYQLVRQLHDEGYTVRVYDPNFSPIIDWPCVWEATASHCIEEEGVTVITTPDPSFERLFPDEFARKPQALIIDCWGVIQEGPWQDTNVIRLGRSQES